MGAEKRGFGFPGVDGGVRGRTFGAGFVKPRCKNGGGETLALVDLIRRVPYMEFLIAEELRSYRRHCGLVFVFFPCLEKLFVSNLAIWLERHKVVQIAQVFHCRVQLFIVASCKLLRRDVKATRA